MRYRIIELASLYPGPLAGRLLTGWGFEILKIEPPEGDPMRRYIPKLFELINMGKYSVTLDLKKEEDREIFYKLTKSSHGIITNYRITTLKKLKASYDIIKTINPDIIYVSITSYRNNDQPGHDINFLASSGALKDQPIIPQCVDVATGILTAFLIAVAILNNYKGYIEVSMELVGHMLNLLNIVQIISGSDLYLTGEYPFYNVYKCLGGYVAVGAVEDKFWRRFCEIINRHDLSDKMFDKDIIFEIQRELLNRRCTDLVVEALRKEVPISLAKDLHEISRKLDIEEIIQKISPVQMRAPKLGEHNDLFKNSG